MARLCPRILQTCFYVSPAPFAPSFRVPGIGMDLILEGEIQIAFSDGTTARAGRNDMVVFYAGLNRYEVVSRVPLSVYQLGFCAANPPLEAGVPCLAPYGKLPHIVPIGDRTNEFAGIYERAMEALFKLDATWQFETTSAIMALLGLTFSVLMKNTPYKHQRLNKWEQLLARLETEGGTISKTQDIAREQGMSVAHFIREFRRRTGKTPKQYLLQRHLWKAKRLLLEGTPVKEAAYKNGFRDPRSFSRLYKQKFGYVPSKTGHHAEIVKNWDPNTSLPVCRHLTAPGVDMRMFNP